ncbi:phosphopantetheine-binding protein [Nocardia sp. CDC159]|uniref:3-oxoacyl-[acyl-carrier-protein] synthase 1 n=1 Tax=Nocardia pulmonis TaxID=2951408 RepID=A0A9X2E7M9_9NOCA|nr:MULTISPECIES: beta-ketoacyl synthase N-terminal-like domain-containing protein [Nocardia]MCM6773176.1 phosphopantetheine-binding protein [Nocardia pulmonis]MCM6785521.1 phosphopantetheine-binding protein [Nocardia sp. CDC159]
MKIDEGVRDEIRNIAARILEVDAEEIGWEDDFREDHDADSLQGIEILAALERSFEITIDQERLVDMVSLAKTYAIVAEALAEKSGKTEQAAVAVSVATGTAASDPAPRRRVVITGLGVISSIGIGAQEFTRALRAGRSGVSPITAFDTNGFEYTNACEVRDFDPAAYIHRLPPGEMGRATQLAVAGARLALDDAGISPEAARELRSVISVGTTNGESKEVDLQVEHQVATGSDKVDPYGAWRAQSSRLSVEVARELEFTTTEAVTIPTACAAGNYAIGYGFDAVAGGEAELAICGGVDALVRSTFVGFYRLGTIAPEVCQPFDRNRHGILTGEGSGVLVLETLESALARGARIYAEVLGYGLSCDAHHPVAPEQDSVARCMARSHAHAGITPAQVDFISAHGTGTKANDLTEVAAIRQVFGDSPPPTISVKSMLGHSMGAASALAAAACAVALQDGFIPPTINHVEPDPDIGIDCVPNHAREADLRIVQNNALAFGGNNAVLILGRYS